MTLLRLGAAAAALCVLAVLLVDGPAPATRDSPVLRARALELVDERGRARAQIDVEPSGEVVLRLRDEGGTIRVKLGASRTGSGLLLLDEATEPGVQALAGRDKTSVTVQRGEQRNEVVP